MKSKIAISTSTHALKPLLHKGGNAVLKVNLGEYDDTDEGIAGVKNIVGLMQRTPPTPAFDQIESVLQSANDVGGSRHAGGWRSRCSASASEVQALAIPPRTNRLWASSQMVI